jgi:hypothetical protein
MSGSREGVAKAIQAAKDIPDHAKAFLLAEIALVPAEFNHVRVDAHFHVEKGVRNGSYTLVPSKQL